jgi:hypothetical protein
MSIHEESITNKPVELSEADLEAVAGGTAPHSATPPEPVQPPPPKSWVTKPVGGPATSPTLP